MNNICYSRKLNKINDMYKNKSLLCIRINYINNFLSATILDLFEDSIGLYFENLNLIVNHF